MIWKSRGDFQKFRFADIDAGHAADAVHALGVERIRLDALCAAETKNLRCRPVDQRAECPQARADSLDFFGVCSRARFFSADALPRNDAMAGVDQIELERDDDVPLQFFGAELHVTGGEAPFPEAQIQIGVSCRREDRQRPALGLVRPSQPATVVVPTRSIVARDKYPLGGDLFGEIRLDPDDFYVQCRFEIG